MSDVPRMLAAQRQRELKRQASDKVGRNKPCPCGSGLKYKRCHGKTVLATAERLRRPPKRRVPLAAAATTQVPVEAVKFSQDETAAAMERAGVRPVVIHAYRKTGLWITEINRAVHSPEDLAAWDSAIDEAGQDGTEPDQARRDMTGQGKTRFD